MTTHINGRTLTILLKAQTTGTLHAPELRSPTELDAPRRGQFRIDSGSLRVDRSHRWITPGPPIPGEALTGVWSTTAIRLAERHPIYGQVLGDICLNDAVRAEDLVWTPLEQEAEDPAELSYGSAVVVGDADCLADAPSREAAPPFDTEWTSSAGPFKKRPSVLLRALLDSGPRSPVEFNAERPRNSGVRLGPDLIWIGRDGEDRVAGVVVDRLAASTDIRWLDQVDSAWDVAVAGTAGTIARDAETGAESADVGALFAGRESSYVFHVGSVSLKSSIVVTDATSEENVPSSRFAENAVNIGVHVDQTTAEFFEAESNVSRAFLVRVAPARPHRWVTLDAASPYGSGSNWRVLSGDAVVHQTLHDASLHAGFQALGKWHDVDFVIQDGRPVAAAIKTSHSAGGYWYAGLDESGRVTALAIVETPDTDVYPLRPSAEDEPLIAELTRRHAEFCAAFPEPDGFESLFDEFKAMRTEHRGRVGPKARGHLHWLARDFLQLPRT